MSTSLDNGPDWWISGKTGHLAPWAQAVVWAAHRIDTARELWLTDDEIASMVTKVGGGIPNRKAIAKWRHVFAEDPNWYPGKTLEEGQKPGPKRLLTEQMANAIAKSQMARKAAGLEPSVPDARTSCPKATINPKTKAPFSDKYILRVFKEKCTDEGSTIPWTQEYPLQKTSLPDFLKDKRVSWGHGLLQQGHLTEGWFFRHCIWIDPCYNILSCSPRQAHDLDMAKKGKKKRWLSKDKKMYARNQRSSGQGGKQCQKGDRKVWWFIVLTRGMVRIEVMGSKWQQTGAGVASFVERLPGILGDMVPAGDALPRVVVSDRGPGLYQGSTGHIVHAYSSALHEQGFRPFAGTDASSQPADIPDVLVHETAVAWVRNYLRRRPFSRSGSLDFQEQKLREVLSQCQQHINSNYKVDDLCRAFPKRLRRLVHETHGDRLRS